MSSFTDEPPSPAASAARCRFTLDGIPSSFAQPGHGIEDDVGDDELRCKRYLNWPRRLSKDGDRVGLMPEPDAIGTDVVDDYEIHVFFEKFVGGTTSSVSAAKPTMT